MNCPYCGKEMQQGMIANADAWRPGDGEWLMGKEKEYVRLWTWTNPKVEGHFCPDCRMIVVPVPETEEPLAAVKNKLKDLKNRAQQQKDTLTADKAAQKEAKQKEQRRKKDPWEV